MPEMSVWGRPRELLIKLGWHWTVVRTLVYMDGHKREDVVKYR